MAKKRPFKQRPTPTRLKKKNKSKRKLSTESDQPDSLSKPVRLQRILANAGFGSRRECEELITEGRVQVDDKVVQTLGASANPDTQKIFVDGQKVKFARRQYFALNKPPGVLSTSKDPSGRTKAIDLIQTDQRIFTVGRLDKASEGLIIVTNDGDFANLLMHPRYGVEKTYHVHVAGNPQMADLKMLRDGVYLAEGFAKVERIKIRKRRKNYTELEMVLDEGRNREIRRLLARIGHKVLRLRRVAIGPFKLGEIPVGAHRRLTRDEIEMLRETALNSAGSSHQRHRKNVRAKSRDNVETDRDQYRGRTKQGSKKRKPAEREKKKSFGAKKKSFGSRSGASGNRKKKKTVRGKLSTSSSRSKKKSKRSSDAAGGASSPNSRRGAGRVTKQRSTKANKKRPQRKSRGRR